MITKHVICSMKFIFVCALLIECAFVARAQVTKVGNDTLLDVACWNVEWFGNTTNGPSNEALQYTNVKSVMSATAVDVWGLAEVCDYTLFTSLLTDLPEYTGVLSTFNQTQKMALVWRKNWFSLIGFQNINVPGNPDYYNAFAGRFPLEVTLKSTWNESADTIYFYVLHLKANSGSGDTSSYNRRKNSIIYLRNWLATNRAGKKIVLLGDWNDDMDQSVVYSNGGYLQTPFQALKADTQTYFIPSLSLSLSGETSYPGFNPKNMIDHIACTRKLSDSFYVAGSSVVLKQLGTQISNFTNTTSDHYPVMARFNLNRYNASPDTTSHDTITSGLISQEMKPELLLYPNPSNGVFYINTSKAWQSIKLFNQLGELVYAQSLNEHTRMLDVSGYVKSGLYVIELSASGFVVRQKYWIHTD